MKLYQKCTKLMLDIESYSLSKNEIDLLNNPFVAGVILFSRNIESISQVQDLCDEIKAVNPTLLIAVDQEGGRVQRLGIGYTKLPSMQQLTSYCARDNFSSTGFVKDIGWLMASEVIATGLDISFAPVLDLDIKTSSIIGDRSFGNSPNVVIKMASKFIDGMNEAGMQAIGKHFPGHGGIYGDSHLGDVEDLRKLDVIEKHDLIPFAALKEKLCGIMTAHIRYSEIDSNIATFSKFWITNKLRNEMDFNGFIFSDDLSMKGTDSIGNISFKVKHALNAGCNILLICNDRPAVIEALNFMKEKKISSNGNLSNLKSSKLISWNKLKLNSRRSEIRKKIRNIF